MEWVCARLGCALGLPIPNYRVVEISEGLAEAWNEGGVRPVEPGPGFGSQFVEGVVEPTEDLLAKMDGPLARRILAFDWWVRNKDRSFKNPNLLWNVPVGCFHVIDHDQAGQPEGGDLFWSLHACAGLRAGEPVWPPDDMRAEFRAVLGLREAVLSELPSAWTRRGEDVGSFFTQLERTLNYEPHQDWRTYD